MVSIHRFGQDDDGQSLVYRRAIEYPVYRFTNHCFDADVCQSHGGMFARAATAEVGPGDDDVVLLRAFRKAIIKTFEKIWEYLFRFRRKHGVGEVSGKHLVGVEVIHVGIVPDAVGIAVVGGGNFHGSALQALVWKYVVGTDAARVGDFTFECRPGHGCRRSQIDAGFFVAHAPFEVAVGGRNHIVTVGGDSLASSQTRAARSRKHLSAGLDKSFD